MGFQTTRAQKGRAETEHPEACGGGSPDTGMGPGSAQKGRLSDPQRQQTQNAAGRSQLHQSRWKTQEVQNRKMNSNPEISVHPNIPAQRLIGSKSFSDTVSQRCCVFHTLSEQEPGRRAPPKQRKVINPENTLEGGKEASRTTRVALETASLKSKLSRGTGQEGLQGQWGEQGPSGAGARR